MKKRKHKRKRGESMKKAAPTRASGRPPATSGRRFVLTGLAASAIVVIAGAFAYHTLKGYLAPTGGNRPPATTAAAGDAQYFERAKVQIFKEDRELGAMAVSEECTAEFFLRNVGGKPLEISQVHTSCMCTYAQVIINDKESPLAIINLTYGNAHGTFPLSNGGNNAASPYNSTVFRAFPRP